jgi:predicted transglutaminase-like cysteine proteinase
MRGLARIVNDSTGNAKVFETNCQVDPNRIVGFSRYLSPTEEQNAFRRGKIMRQKTNKIATFAATIVVSGSLLYVMGDNSAYPREYQAPAEQVSFDIPAVAPVEFFDLSRSFDAQMERASFATASATPEDLSPQSDAAIQRVNFETPAPALATLPTPAAGTDPQQVKVVTPSPVRMALYSTPRRLEADVDRLNFDAPTLAPMAFMRFCMRYLDDCKVGGLAFRPRPVSLTPARRAELVVVNREVNHAIAPQANTDGVMAEEWLVSPREGDCNDYAVTKRHELLARGWPSRALLLAEVVVPSGEHHLVLVVRTREQDLVLDNLNWNVRPISQIQYQWVRAQQANNPKFWSAASVLHSTRVAMNTR